MIDHLAYAKFGESLAVHYLEHSGYRIIARNYRTPVGEIDIVARDRDTLVFVEVKARRSFRYGSPKLAVTPRKQQKIAKTALWYLKATRQTNVRARFDVLAINQRVFPPKIELVKNAFQLSC